MNKALNRVVFVVGWLLSPLTFWNDVFINLPIAYILAIVVSRALRVDLLLAMIISYWLTNILGIGLMVITGKALVKNKSYAIKEARIYIIAIIAYTAIVVVLYRLGIIRPL